MKEYFADLHIHIGSSEDGGFVKITASKDLTFANIIEECVERKGIDIVGIVDTGSPRVQRDIKALLRKGLLEPLSGGGYLYRERVSVILGSEVETTEEGGGCAHSVSYFPTLEQVQEFTGAMGGYIKNLDLSTQKARTNMAGIYEITSSLGGILVPAHVFTPHKSVYGNCGPRLKNLVGEKAFSGIYGVELGLSSDSDLADRLAELEEKTFITNSDAHSLPKIAREYNLLELEEVSFKELVMALKREGGRRVAKNFGLNPRLGKYHRTHCLECDRITDQTPPVLSCHYCGSPQIIRGVLDRITEICDYPEPVHPAHRGPYVYQVPLQFLPKVGPKTMTKLLARFGTEMAVLHKAGIEELEEVVGTEVAANICRIREGKVEVIAGGGGRYGRITPNHKEA